MWKSGQSSRPRPYPFRESHHTVTFRARGHFRRHSVLEVESCQLLLVLTPFRKWDSEVPQAKRSFTFFRTRIRVCDHASLPNHPISLFLEHFRRKLRSTPLLAQALNRTGVENCTSEREVWYLARLIHSSRAHRRSLNNGYYSSPKIFFEVKHYGYQASP